MSETPGYYVLALKRGISASAAVRGSSPYAVKEKVPVEFDFTRPSCRLVNTARYQRPTIFPTREEAEQKTEEFLSRCRAIIRNNENTGQHVPVGDAFTLVAKDYGAGPIGGYEVAPLAGLLAEWNEDRRLRERKDCERLTAAEAEAAEAAARADRVRAELEASTRSEGVDGPSGEWSAHPSHKGVQWRQRASDGRTVYRGRSSGKTSEGFDSVEAALTWQANDGGEGNGPTERDMAAIGERILNA